jgi:glycosyltransferase involved in cell wall biosynthesis
LPKAQRKSVTTRIRRRVSLIVPVCNEAAAIEPFLNAVSSVLQAEPPKNLEYEIIFINDGSTDDTLEKLIDFQKRDDRIRIVDLSRNFGKEAALTAGLDECTADAAIPLDVDLQDPPELVPKLVSKWLEGYEIVLAKRADRSTDSAFKSKSAAYFYRVHNWLSAITIPENVGDFRLIDRIALDALSSMPERRRFMKGLFAWLGFRTATVEYHRKARIAGSSNFSGWKLWNLALEGITSFSSVPLEIWAYLGMVISGLSFFYGGFIAIRTLFLGVDVPGYASIMASILFLGGIQLMSIGILGQYVGRIYSEVKQRPIYLIRKTYEPEKD